MFSILRLLLKNNLYEARKNILSYLVVLVCSSLTGALFIALYQAQDAAIDSFGQAVEVLGGEGLILRSTRGEESLDTLSVDLLSLASQYTVTPVLQRQGVFAGKSLTMYGTFLPKEYRCAASVEVSQEVMSLFGITGPCEKRATVPPDSVLLDIGVMQEVFHTSAVSFFILSSAEHALAAKKLSGRSIGSDNDSRPVVAEPWRIEERSTRANEVKRLLQAFTTNLSALVLVTALVCAYTVFAVFSLTTVRKRKSIAVLSQLGCAPLYICLALVLEVLVISLPIALFGVVLSQPIIELIQYGFYGTVTEVYKLHRVATTDSILSNVVALYLVTVALALCGVLPLLRYMAPRVVSLSSRRIVQITAAVCLVTGYSIFRAFTAGDQVSAYGSVLALIVSTALLARSMLDLSASAALRFLNHRTPFLTGLLRRDSSLVGGVGILLALSLCIVTSLSCMRASFDYSLRQYLDTVLYADIYISSRTHEGTIADERLAALRRGLSSSVQIIRSRSLVSDGVHLTGVEHPDGKKIHPFLPVTADDLLHIPSEGDWLMVSEQVGRSKNIKRGDLVQHGSCRTAVAGMIHDFSSEQGTIYLPYHTLERCAGTSLEPHAIGVFTRGDITETLAQIRKVLPEALYEVRAQQVLKNHALTVFAQTFLVTRIMQALVLFLNVIAFAFAAAQIFLQRAPVLSLLTILGASKLSLVGETVLLALGVGVIEGGLGIAMGIGLGAILVEVINPATFGWSLLFRVPVDEVMLCWGVAVCGALIASAYAAYRGSSLVSLQEVSHE